MTVAGTTSPPPPNAAVAFPPAYKQKVASPYFVNLPALSRDALLLLLLQVLLTLPDVFF